MSLLTREEIKKVASSCHDQGKRIVFTNGCFDVLHPGHFKLLRKAAQEGDILFVGINSDGSVKNLKGPQRPIFSEDERASMVDQIRWVDYVVVFTEDTATNLLKEIKPQVYVKGGDYARQVLPERKIVDQLGTRLVLIPLLEDYSTTRAIDKMKG